MDVFTKKMQIQRAAIGLPPLTGTLVDALPDPEPTKPAPASRLEQLRQRLACGLLAPAELAELQKLREPAEREAARKWRFEQLSHLLATGHIDQAEYLKRRHRLNEEREKDSAPIFESPTPEEQKKHLWEQHRAGKVSLDATLSRCAQIRLTEEQSRAATLRHERQALIETGRTRFQILNEKNSSEGLAVKGVLSIADKRNGNGRVYPLELWSKQIAKLQPLLAQKKVVGATDHPGDGVSRISEAAIRWDKIWMEGPITYGEGLVLNTKAGRDLQAMIKAGIPVDISSRGFGTVTQKTYRGEQADVVEGDFDLISFDAVLGGSVDGAELRVA